MCMELNALGFASMPGHADVIQRLTTMKDEGAKASDINAQLQTDKDELRKQNAQLQKQQALLQAH